MAAASMLAPMDFDTQQAIIERKRKMIEQLAQQASNPQGQMVSGHYIAPNWMQQVADLGGAALQAFGNKSLDEQSQQNTKNYQQGLGDAVQQYLKTREGHDEEMQGPTADGSAMPSQHIAGDPRKAMVDAITSQYKPLQQLGMAEMGQLGKQSMTAKDVLGLVKEGGISLKSAQEAIANGMDVARLQSDPKVHVVNGQLVQLGGEGKPMVAGDYRDRFTPVGTIGQGPDGKPIMGQTNSGTGEAKFAPQGTTVNVDTAQKGAGAFSVKSNEEAVKQLVDSKASAEKAAGSLTAFQNAAKVIGDMPGGLAAQPIQSAKRFLAMFGADDPSIQNFEQVNQALKTAVLDNAHVFGTGNGFTDKDREELARIVGADPSLAPATLNYVVNKGLAGSMNTLLKHQANLRQAGSIQGSDPAVLGMFNVDMPPLSIDGSRIEQDPRTKYFKALGGAGELRDKAVEKATPPQHKQLSPAEQKELEELRAWSKGRK